MSKLVFHSGVNRESVVEDRLYTNLMLSPTERLKKAFTLMALATLFKKGAIKAPQGLGLVLKRKK